MCPALGHVLAPLVLCQEALEAFGQTGGSQGLRDCTLLRVSAEPGLWLLAAFPHRQGAVPPPWTVSPLTGQTPVGMEQDSPQGSHSSCFKAPCGEGGFQHSLDQFSVVLAAQA